MARAINRITAVLAGGIQQHVTCGLTEFGWVWLTPLPPPAFCSQGLSPRCHCFFGKLLGMDTGVGCSRQRFSWGKVTDSSTAGKSERGRNNTASGGWEPESGRREIAFYWGMVWFFPSPSWILQLETPRALWIYAFTDCCGPNIEIKTAVEL